MKRTFRLFILTLQKNNLLCSYMILAPATMAKEKDPKEAARKCLEEIGLDPESYRVGHTKARGISM